MDRIESVFWPSKGRAALRAIVCLATSIPFFVFGGVWVAFGFVFLTYGVWYGFVWLYKSNRDQRLQQLPSQAQPKQTVITKTSPGSDGRLAVPRQLDRR